MYYYLRKNWDPKLLNAFVCTPNFSKIALKVITFKERFAVQNLGDKNALKEKLFKDKFNKLITFKERFAVQTWVTKNALKEKLFQDKFNKLLLTKKIRP